jgi:multiple sugar transport system substrate-binding protein
MQTKRLNRRDFLRLSALTAAGAALAGCTCPPAGPAEPAVVTVETEKEVEVKVTTPPEVVEVTVPPEGPVDIRWFIGLGTGSKPEEIEPENRFVEYFNTVQSSIVLTPEIVDNEVAFDTLKTEIAAGNPPDLVGPVGVRGTNEFKGSFLDLRDYISAYDMSDFVEGAIKGWTMPDDGLIGLPIGVYPSALFVNYDLFDEAGLDYPPTDYADAGDWTVEAMTDLALQLTVDANGNDATSAAFDPENIVQFGFHHQWTDPRGWGSFFGGGNFVADDGETAQCPDHWREAFNWHYDNMWTTYCAPNGPYINSELLSGNPFGSGNVAMAHCHTWFTCCVPTARWDFGCNPSYHGTTTCKLHTDMVGALAATRNKEAAVEAAYGIATSPQLIDLWGVLPALVSLQEGYISALSSRFPHVENWDTVLAGLNYVDVPNHEAYMPNFSQADDRVKAFQSELEGTGRIRVNAAIDTLVSDLQAIFDAA